MATSNDKNTPLYMKIVIIVFAVILVTSLCLPFFSSCSNSTQGTADDAATSSTSDVKTMAEVDEANQSIIDSLESKLAANSTGSGSLSALANLGNAYMNWGGELQQASDYSTATAAASSLADASAASDSVAGDSAAQAHVEDIFATAVDYYDQYLALNDSDVVRMNRAVCLYYAGSQDDAISALEELTQSNEDFSPAWYRLGIFYQLDGETSAAKDAYNRAISADAKESYGVSVYAQIYLAMLQAAESASSSTGDAAAASSVARDSDLSASSSADGTVGGGALPDAALALDAPEASGDAPASSTAE